MILIIFVSFDIFKRSVSFTALIVIFTILFFFIRNLSTAYFLIINIMHIFLVVNQLSDWMKEKLKTATDESYRDLSNLQAKLQKHAAFEAELKANNERLNGINKVIAKLILFCVSLCVLFSS